MVKVIVMSHHTRDASNSMKSFERQGFEVYKNIDTTNQTLEDRYFGLRKNYLECLSLYDFCDKIVCHDDVLLKPKSSNHINEIIEASENDPVSFFSPDAKCYDSRHIGNRIAKSNFLWTQCVFYKKQWIVSFIDYCKDKDWRKYSEDGMVKEFLKKTNSQVCYVSPNLAQHIGFDRSTFGISGRIGKMARFSKSYNDEFHSAIWGDEFLKANK